MNGDLVSSLKLIYKHSASYYGEWELIGDLEYISLINKNKNLFKEFIERYYYMPLNVIFKDEVLIRGFKYSIVSKEVDGKRNLYFSKKAFLKNIISNSDEVLNNGGKDAYKKIKTAIRKRKDMYRDVLQKGEKSKFFKELEKEYLASGARYYRSFIEYLTLCKKKFTRLLTGYNMVLELFDKPISVEKFIKCFDVNQLYLLTAYSLLKNSEKQLSLYGRADYNIVHLDNYRKLVDDIRKTDGFYNSHIMLKNNIMYTIDDLFKEYDKLLDSIGC